MGKNSFFALILLFFVSLSYAQEDDMLYFFKAELSLNQNYTEYAVKYIDSIQVHNYSSNFLEAKIAFELKNIEKSIQYYKLCNLQKNNFADLELAKCYAVVEKYDSASFFLSSHLKSQFKTFSNTIISIKEFKAFKNTEYWKSIGLNNYYSKQEKDLERAIYYKNNDELSLALDILDELIIENKGNTEAYYYRARFIILLNQDYNYAIKDLKKIVKIQPNNYKYNTLLADYYMYELKYKKALEYYLIARKLNKYDLSDYLKISNANYRSGLYPEAIANIKYFLEIDDLNTDGYKLAGQIFYDKGELENSILYLTKAVYIDGRRLDVLTIRGKAYLENENYQKAGRDFNIALDFDANNGELWYLKGLAFLYQKKRDEACKYFTKASYLNYYKAEEYLLQECQ